MSGLLLSKSTTGSNSLHRLSGVLFGAFIVEIFILGLFVVKEATSRLSSLTSSTSRTKLSSAWYRRLFFRKVVLTALLPKAPWLEEGFCTRLKYHLRFITRRFLCTSAFSSHHSIFPTVIAKKTHGAIIATEMIGRFSWFVEACY